MGSIQEITIRPATLEDVPSLSTIVARSFHGKNQYIKKCFPDTTAVRNWWSESFSREIENDDCRVFSAFVPSSTSSPSPSQPATAVGVLCCRRMGSNEKGNGLFDLVPMTSDHDLVLCEPMLGGMAENRERLMLGRPHFLIELFGVDDIVKGQGVGGSLLQAACKFADDSGLGTFVQANGNAKGFYEKFGFVLKTIVRMPEKEGVDEYLEYMLVREFAEKK